MHMVKHTIASIILAIGLASVANAQSLPIDRLTPPLPTAGERKAADVTSWVLDIGLVGWDTYQAFKSEDRVHALTMEGARMGVVYGGTFVLKYFLHRERPCAPDDCGSDNPHFSFPSGHTAVGWSTLGAPHFELRFQVPMVITEAGLRIAAGKHWLTDTIFGAILGSVASRIR